MDTMQFLIPLYALISAVIGAITGYLAGNAVYRTVRRDMVELSYDVETVVKTMKRRNVRDAMQSKRDDEGEDDELVKAARLGLDTQSQNDVHSGTNIKRFHV